MWDPSPAQDVRKNKTLACLSRVYQKPKCLALSRGEVLVGRSARRPEAVTELLNQVRPSAVEKASRYRYRRLEANRALGEPQSRQGFGGCGHLISIAGGRQRVGLRELDIR